MLTRRQAVALGIGVPTVAAVTLAGCGPNTSGSGGGSESGSGSGGASLRLAWWGNPSRNELTSEAVAAYAEVAPDVTISEEPGEWSGYWDKLATQFAGGDAPDIIQMDEKYLTEYGGRGSLLELSEAGLDTSGFADGTVELGELPEIGLIAINAGLNAPAVIVNPTIFEQAGVEVPDDTTWTWEDMVEAATAISENTEDGVYGISQLGLIQAVFQVWMRQLGQDQYSEEGVGFDVGAATEFYEFGKRLQEEGAGPQASLASEDAGLPIAQSLFATGKSAMTVAWSNQIVAYDEATDGDIQLFRTPSMTGSAADAQLWYKASMYWSVASSAASPEAAVAFVDYLVNDVDAARILGVERGVPGNLECRKAAAEGASESEMKAIDFLDAIEPELGPAPAVTPMGASNFEALLKRNGEDALFGDASPEDAAAGLHEQLTTNVA